MIGCCCTDEPCCAQRLFREDGKNLPELTLTLESRQRWQAFALAGASTPTCSSLIAPPTTTITSQEITLTYANPIPSAFLSGAGAGSWDDLFFPAKGWYLGPSVTLWAVSGDPVWTGSATTITGKYFFSPCHLGIWFDSDATILEDVGGERAPEWQNYIGLRQVDWLGTSSNVSYNYFSANTPGSGVNLPQYTLRTDGSISTPGVGAVVRGFILKDFGPSGCRPILSETIVPEQCLSVYQNPCSSSIPSPGRHLAPMRLQEPFDNPLNTNMALVSSTPPSSVLALESTHYVEEQFHMLFTLTEPSED
jgi:hypothetical protein